MVCCEGCDVYRIDCNVDDRVGSGSGGLKYELSVIMVVDKFDFVWLM